MKTGVGLIASMTIGVCINAVAAAPEIKTYSSPDGIFQFQYSALIMCVRHGPNALNAAYPWAPSDCWDWAEGCGHESSPSKTTVCLAFPATDLNHPRMVTGGTVSVAEVTDKARESSCLDLSEHLFEGLATDQVHVGDVSFIHVERAYAGGGHGDSHSIYRNFHNRTCYQIEITVDTLNGDFGMTFDDAMAVFAEDTATVRNRMRQVVDTFKYLR